ncbi:PH domain-containing protein [Sphingosinicella sp. YJ22]|uniref:PH domain-containing protein n=1 Tax=Sphingosinicella sp. YJ22 TaxID=1104780 RepID=UPI00140DEAC5|nr:PH domain-containing protein [Sphingosinicella sp. YJ22]
MGFFSATETSVDDVQRDYAPILIPGENVLAAFKTVRDLVFLTNYRLALVDVQGLTGRKVDVQSIPYKSIVRYSVETAGTFDLDADVKIWVSGSAAPIEVKIGRGSNTVGVQQILARGVFGPR